MTEPVPTATPASKPMRKAAARLGAVQALYQMDVAATPVNEILAEFESHWLGQEIEGDQYPDADMTLFRTVVQGVLAEQRTIDPLVDEALTAGWPLRRVEVVLRAVLRAGAFLDRDETGMVNAVLDSLARDLRASEFAKGA